jgi:nuclease HARBI1
MEVKFGHCQAFISAVCSMFIDALYALAVPSLTNTGLFHHRFPVYTEKIAVKTGNAAINIWGFINRTLKKMCWPTHYQKAAYSGHKCCHGIKFQNVTTPDGYVAHLYGPIAGCRHDSYMLSCSKLLLQLHALMPPGQGTIYSLFGDPAYPMSAYLYGGVTQLAPGSIEAAWNTKIASARIAVEWTFGEVGRQFRQLDLKQALMNYKMPVAKYYAVAVFLVNCQNSCYGGETALYFSCEPMTGGIHWIGTLELKTIFN